MNHFHSIMHAHRTQPIKFRTIYNLRYYGKGAVPTEKKNLRSTDIYASKHKKCFFPDN